MGEDLARGAWGALRREPGRGPLPYHRAVERVAQDRQSAPEVTQEARRGALDWLDRRNAERNPPQPQPQRSREAEPPGSKLDWLDRQRDPAQRQQDAERAKRGKERDRDDWER